MTRQEDKDSRYRMAFDRGRQAAIRDRRKLGQIRHIPKLPFCSWIPEYSGYRTGYNAVVEDG